jgi:hypothetical protein
VKVRHKVLQGYSPADENAGSLMLFRMTVTYGSRIRKDLQIYAWSPAV